MDTKVPWHRPGPRKRRVCGAPGYIVSADGTLRRNNRPVAISYNTAGLPTVDLGENYEGPVLPPGAAFTQTEHGTTERLRAEGERLLDEIVALEFHGPPPDGFKYSRVLHLDGRMWNCAATNLAWKMDDDAAAIVNLREFASHMRPDFLPPPELHRPWDSIYLCGPMKQLNFVSSGHVIGHVPTTPLSYQETA